MTDFARLASYDFGAGGTGVALLEAGWSAPEPAFTWSAAAACAVRVPVPDDAGPVFVRVLVRPFVAPPGLVAQRVRVGVDGAALEDAVLEGEAWLGFRAAGGAVMLRFVLPDACVPRDAGLGLDTRLLGVALLRLSVWRDRAPAAVAARRLPPLPVRAFDFGEAAVAALRGVAALSVPALLGCFESLGHNCEFGLLQRRGGAEPLGLLRFASIGQPALIDGLDHDFEGVDDPALLTLHVEGEPRAEFMVSHARYGLHGHTFRYPDESEEEAVRAALADKLRFERRRFLEVLRSGEKLFVFHGRERVGLAEGRAILHALKRHGPAALLIVSVDEGEAPGSVSLIERDLYAGAMLAFAPLWAADRVDLTGWISVCANAYRLWREQGFGADA